MRIQSLVGLLSLVCLASSAPVVRKRSHVRHVSKGREKNDNASSRRYMKKEEEEEEEVEVVVEADLSSMSMSACMSVEFVEVVEEEVVEEADVEVVVESMSMSMSVPADLAVATCSFCPDGVVDPDLVLVEGSTCGSVATYAATITADDMMCGTVNMATSKCCPPPAEEVGTIVDIGIADPNFSTLVAAVTAAGLVETLAGPGPFTLFAPTNDAFAALPMGTVDFLLLPENIESLKGVLMYHVLDGTYMSADLVTGDVVTLATIPVTITVSDAGVMVNDATVTTADFVASNGVIHVIDKVLIPPVEEVVEEPVETGEPVESVAEEVGTIVDIGIADPNFSTLVAAVTAAGLVETLAGPGPFTLFAPTNDAFAALPMGTVDFLLLPENIESLKGVLMYHVLGGTYMSADLVTGDVVTLATIPVTITVSDAGVMVNDATVTTADFVASNGVIHVIDKVLIPPVEEVVEEPVEEVVLSMPIEEVVLSIPTEVVEPSPVSMSLSAPSESVETLFGAKSGKGGKGKKSGSKSSKALPVKDAKAEKVVSSKSTKLAKVRRD